MSGLIDISGIVESVGNAADSLFTSDEERGKLELEHEKIEASLKQGQMDVNKVEAQHPSIFVAGWRPFMGWVGGFAMCYQFIVYPFMTWLWAYLQAAGHVPKELPPPPQISTDALWVIITGMLGMSTTRTVEKLKGKETTGVER